MPVTHFSKVFAVKDCKLYPLLTDEPGEEPTYGTGVDVPGIKMVDVSGDIEVKELRGDNQLLDTDAVLKNVKLKLSHAKLSLDAMGVVIGGAVTDSGTTPNQVAKWLLKGGTKLGTFKLEAISASADPVLGNIKMEIYKCKAASFPKVGFAEEDYQIPEFDLTTMPLIGNDEWMSLEINETAAVLS